MNDFKLSFEQPFSAFEDSFMLALTKFKEQKVGKNCKILIKGSLKAPKGVWKEHINSFSISFCSFWKLKKGAKGCWKRKLPFPDVGHVVRATADGGAGLAGDPKLNIFTEQLLQIAHLAGDPKRKG